MQISRITILKRSGGIQALLERGLQRKVDFENRWPEALGTLLET
jgi:hypothetical protein